MKKEELIGIIENSIKIGRNNNYSNLVIAEAVFDVIEESGMLASAEQQEHSDRVFWEEFINDLERLRLVKIQEKKQDE